MYISFIEQPQNYMLCCNLSKIDVKKYKTFSKQS